MVLNGDRTLKDLLPLSTVFSEKEGLCSGRTKQPRKSFGDHLTQPRNRSNASLPACLVHHTWGNAANLPT